MVNESTPFAFVCCCCCTWAAASSEGLRDRDHLDYHGEVDPKFSALSHDLPEIQIEDNEEFDEFTLHEQEGEHGHSYNEPEEEDWSKSQAWGYATLANTVCVMLSVAGIGIILCNKRASPKTMNYIYDFFIALGVSTMLGDAFLHILPAVLGLHSHDEEDDHGHEHRADPDDHGHSHDAEPVEEPDLYMEAIKKLSVVVGIIYFFWIFEQTMSIMGHGHSHGGATVAHDDEMMTRKTISDEKEKEKEDEASKSNKIAPAIESTDFGDEVEAVSEKKTDWREHRSAIIGILVGDCIHNFVDGLALGTTWAKGWETGLATTIALFLHELPHELSDFTIYIKFGLSNAKALLANLFSAMLSYGGLYTGLALASNTAASEWLLAMVAGLFVYIVLVDIIPELKLKGSYENKWTRFAIQNVGMTLGFIILAMLGVFEGRSHSHDHDHDH